MNKEQFLNSGLIEQYVLGLTDSEESAIVEEFAQQDPAIANEIKELQLAMEQYAAQHAIPTPPGMKEKVMEKVGGSTGSIAASPTSPRRGISLMSLLSFVGMCAALVLLFFQTQGKQAALKQLNKQTAEFEAFRQKCEQQQANSNQHIAMSTFFQDPATQAIELKGMNQSAATSALAYWNEKQEKGFVDLSGLPAPPEGKIYQIWADVDGKMINAGVLDSQFPYRVQTIKYIAQAESLNITLEPKGGSDHPTVELLQANGFL
jgi:anti-sigma-K factor RskA